MAGSLWWPCVLITVVFMVAYLLSACRGHFLPSSSSASFGPVLCVIFAAAAKRVVDVNEIARSGRSRSGSWWENPSFKGFSTTEVLIGICAVVFLIVAVIHTMIGHSKRRGQSEEQQARQRELHPIYSLAAGILYVFVAILSMPIALHMSPALSVGLGCVAFLSGVYLICHIWYQISSKILGKGEDARYFAALAGLAAASANFAPILCVLMLGVQIGLDITGMDIAVVNAYMQLCCILQLLLVLFAILVPLALRATLQLDLRSGMEALVIPKEAAMIVTLIRWILKALLFWSAWRLCSFLWTLTPLEPQLPEMQLLRLLIRQSFATEPCPYVPAPPCQLLPAQLLVFVVMAYFLIYLLLATMMTVKLGYKSVSEASSAFITAKELAVLFPMVGAFIAQWWFCSQW